ncbi:MAG: Ig domain-containing protein [Bryobacter sp.]|nr:Ig domain-containing protein [Bryobacter sp.]
MRIFGLVFLLASTLWAQVTISPTEIPTAFTGEAYSVNFTAAVPGGTGAIFTFSLDAGTLPTGLMLSPTGQLSGTTFATGFFPITIRATTTVAAASVSGTRNYTLLVASFDCPNETAVIGSTYDSAATVFPTADSFAVTGGSLPTGLSFFSSGALIGVPQFEEYTSFTVTFSYVNGGSGSRTCSVFVNSRVGEMTPLSTARLGLPYRSQVSAYGGTSPYTFTLTGSLPAGLALNGSTGAITGTPTALGNFAFGVIIADGAGQTTFGQYGMNVIARPPPSPVLRCPAPSGSAGSVYSSGFSINANVSAYNLAAGALPTGLTLNPLTGAVSGVLDSSQFETFTVQALLSGGSTVTAECTIETDEVTAAPAAGLCPDQLDLVVGEPVWTRVPGTGNRRPLSYELYQTTLPAGLSLDEETGIISGSPTQVGSTLTAFRILDHRGFFSTTDLCPFNVAPGAPLSILTTSLPNGVLNSPYSFQLVGTGGAPPYFFSQSAPGPTFTGGSLPPGLTLSSSGLISGTPTAVGTFNFTIFIEDTSRSFNSRAFNITIFAPDPLRFSGLGLPSGTVGLPYDQLIGVEGGAPPYSIQLTSGSVPGLTFLQGRVRGTPTVAGNFPLSVSVTDSAGATLAANFSLGVSQGSFRIGCPAFSGELGVPYNSTAVVLGGTAPYQFRLLEGSLPAGLSLNAATGQVSGRPSETGALAFIVAVTDASGLSTAARCGIAIVGGTLRILTQGPILTQAGRAYSGSIEAAGGRPPYRFGVLGNPAPGLNLAESGTLAGTASRVGEFVVAISATDAAGQTAQLPIVFRNGPSNLAVACPAPATAPVGLAANLGIVLTGGVAPFTLSAAAEDLPPGMALVTPNASGAGSLSGTPARPGTFRFNLTAADATQTTLTRSCQVEITGTPLSIVTEEMPDGTVGLPYFFNLIAEGGTAPLRFSLAGGALPPGLSMLAETGAIEGTPTRAGSYVGLFEVRDRTGQTSRRSLALTIQEGELPLTITTLAPLGDAVVGRPYAQTFVAEGGTPPYVITTEGDVPAGLSLGRGIFGTPTAAGEGAVLVTAQDSTGAIVSRTYPLRVLVDPALFILTDTLPDGTLEQPYRAGLEAQGGSAPYRWSLLSGRIPDGVAFDSATGTFGGTPTAPGQFDAFVLVEDNSGNVSRKGYRFEVRPAGVERLEISTAALPDAPLGRNYRAALAASGGQAPFRWTVLGALPPGLSANESGEITGIPTRTGRFALSVEVVDSLGLRAARQLFVVVTASVAPGVAITGLPDSLGPNAQAAFGLTVNTPLDLSTPGRFVLSFQPDEIHNADDPAVRFGNGQRELEFQVPNAMGPATLPSGARVETGTLAGTITVAVGFDLGGTALRGPSQAITLRRAAPVITAVRLTRSGSGIEVRVEGFTNTRQLGEARLTFAFANNVDVTGSNLATVNVAAAIQSWFASAASAPFGGRFALTIPLTVSGDPANVTGVSVVLTNGEGTSNAVTAQ